MKRMMNYIWNTDHDGFPILVGIFFISIFCWVAFWFGFDHGGSTIINQIGNGSHEVITSKNDFGTVEIRYVEVEY